MVLAANAIGSARLLLLSAGGAFPDGLANTSGLVGRRLMMHPFAVATGVFAEPLETWRGNVGSRIHSLQFYESDERRGFVRGAKWSLAPSTGGPMNAAMPARAGAAVWGPEHHARVRERFGHCLSWGIFGEDLPDEDNRVTLDPVLADASGRARAARHLHGRRRTRGGCSTSTSRGRASRCSRPARGASTR